MRFIIAIIILIVLLILAGCKEKFEQNSKGWLVYYVDDDGVFYDTQDEALRANIDIHEIDLDTMDANGVVEVDESDEDGFVYDPAKHSLQALHERITVLERKLDLKNSVMDLEIIREKATTTTGFYICKETALDEEICDCAECSIQRAMQDCPPSKLDYPNFESAPPERFYR